MNRNVYIVHMYFLILNLIKSIDKYVYCIDTFILFYYFDLKFLFNSRAYTYVMYDILI